MGKLDPGLRWRAGGHSVGAAAGTRLWSLWVLGLGCLQNVTTQSQTRPFVPIGKAKKTAFFLAFSDSTKKSLLGLALFFACNHETGRFDWSSGAHPVCCSKIIQQKALKRVLIDLLRDGVQPRVRQSGFNLMFLSLEFALMFVRGAVRW